MNNTTTRPPAQDTTRTVWTKYQQQQLEDLIKYKETAMAMNRPPVHELADTCLQVSAEHLTDWLIDNATAVREVLRPFDLEASK